MYGSVLGGRIYLVIASLLSLLRYPDELTETLQEAIAAWERGEPQVAR